MAKTDLTAQRLRELLHYDPETGVFTWRVRMSNVVHANTIAGAIETIEKYRSIKIGGYSYKAHRLAWFYMTGEWPPHEVDHINGERSDNRWANLRSATKSQNQQNTRKPRAHGTSGFLGVSKRRHNPPLPWLAQIRINGQGYNLGQYATPEEAHSAYLEAKRKMHPFNTI